MAAESMPSSEHDFCAPVICDFATSSVTPEIKFSELVWLGPVPDWYADIRQNLRQIIFYDDRIAALTGSIRTAAVFGDERDSVFYQVPLAPVAVWCVKPAEFGINMVVGRPGANPSVAHSPLPRAMTVEDSAAPLVRQDLEQAAEIFRLMLSAPLRGPVHTALQMIRKALEERANDLKIVMLWIALEALFGIDDKELSFRISMHLGLYLGNDPNDRREIAQLARQLYNVRSKVVHGTNRGSDRATLREPAQKMERLVRRAMLAICTRLDVHRFNSADRRRLFDDLFYGAGT